jgi:16S rRNA (guanine966-N2)-methyltransferase
VDLFAGSGALGLEALSRGAARATLIEQHVPTAEIIRQNVAALGVEQTAQVVTANVFIWFRRRPDLGPLPWVVFCSPPYDFFVDRSNEMLELIGGVFRSAAAESIFVVESDARFDFSILPDAGAWDVRSYPPTVVGVYEKPG